MSKVMHINARNGSPQGFVFTMCGALLWPGQGALLDAPICPKCMRKLNKRR